MKMFVSGSGDCVEGLRKRRMKGGKDEEKKMNPPLFPRLRSNETEKGGPRAPPRNKMALYEKLSIHSQRFTSGSAPMLPLQPNNNSSLVPSTSSSRVQRLIAGSPESMLEDSIYLGKTSMKLSPARKLPSENVLEPPPLIVKPNGESEKSKPRNERVAENALGKPPLPSLKNDTDKPYSGIPPLASTAPDANLAPWCLQPPGNQWLVPVRSPSEGLVYKPYTGPCPPTGGLVAPVYGSCGPMCLTPLGGDVLTYGVPTPHQGIGFFPGTPLGQTYLAPYGVPVMNPSSSSSSVEQVIPFARAQSNGLDNQLPIRDINFAIPSYQSSRNIFSQKSGVIPSCLRNLQGSTASGPAERAEGDALPLFPTAPVVQVSDQPSHNHSPEQQIQVIKVVPHNPKSASESAARIFQSIQEERKQYD